VTCTTSTSEATFRMSRSSLLAQLNSELQVLIKECLPKTCTIFPMHRAQRLGNGSGWFYGSDLIVTNNHNLPYGAESEIMVRTAQLGEFRVSVRGCDPETDLAVLHAPGLKFDPFSVRDAPAQIGELCLAIGTPLGERNQDSVSFGVVSGLGRQVYLGNFKHEESIQTDALINQGNSGGPLVDVTGQVIGVNFAGAPAREGGSSGIGYAIPSEVVRDIVPELIEHGSVARATIGISITARSLKTESGIDSRLQVVKVSNPDSSLKQGDIIMSVNGQAIHRRYQLMRLLNRRAIGTSLTLEIQRSGSVLKVDVSAVAKPPRPPVDPADSSD